MHQEGGIMNRDTVCTRVYGITFEAVINEE
jgi:hypothetical protein